MIGRYEDMQAVADAAATAFPYSGYGHVKVGDDVAALETSTITMEPDSPPIKTTHVWIGKVTEINYHPMRDSWSLTVNVRTGSRTYHEVRVFEGSLAHIQRVTYKPTFRGVE